MKKVYRFAFLAIVYFTCTFQFQMFSQKSSDQNLLNMINYNVMNPALLELGSLVLYFEHEPIMNLIHQIAFDKDSEQRTFLFPLAKVVSQEVRRAIKNINENQEGLYSLEMQEVLTPIQGIQLVIQYDPNRITIDYDFSDSIDLKKGVVFRFYNSQLIQKIKGVQKGMLQTS